MTDPLPGTDEKPPWMADFVLETPTVARERHGTWDLYDPEAAEPRPLVVFVHGGPIPPDIADQPRDWPTYRGYGALAASGGVVGLTVDHRLYGLDRYDVAYRDVIDAVDEARADDRVDDDRIGVWVFSGGGPLIGPLLAEPPTWLRVLAATYPVLGSSPGRDLPDGFRPAEVVGTVSTRLPFVLTRVGLEAPDVAETVEAFMAAAEGSALDVEIIDVPHGHHGFDARDYGDESRHAVRDAVAAVLKALDVSSAG